jgi:hypothetical protein
MISFWHLSAVCCIPSPNPTARTREQEIFKQVGATRKELAIDGVKSNGSGRWEKREKPAPVSRFKAAA